jgi:hypothetical protein
MKRRGNQGRRPRRGFERRQTGNRLRAIRRESRGVKLPCWGGASLTRIIRARIRTSTTRESFLITWTAPRRLTDQCGQWDARVLFGNVSRVVASRPMFRRVNGDTQREKFGRITTCLETSEIPYGAARFRSLETCRYNFPTREQHAQYTAARPALNRKARPGDSPEKRERNGGKIVYAELRSPTVHASSTTGPQLSLLPHAGGGTVHVRQVVSGQESV